MQDYWGELQLLNSARIGPVGAGSGPVKRSAHECEVEAAAALAGIAERQRQQLFCSRTQAALDSIIKEFDSFLCGLHKPGRDTWATCTDLEVLIFLEAHYLEQHDGANGGDVAPSTLARAISTLKRAFGMHNRSGPWVADPALGPPHGNPCDSQNLTDFQTAYAKGAQTAGVYEISATPLPAAAFAALMQGIDDEIDDEWHAVCRGGGDAGQLVRLCRDAAMFSTLWSSARRGGDVLQLTWERLHDGDYAPVAPQWAAQLRMGFAPSAGSGILLAVPLSTKTEKARRASTWVLPVAEGYSPLCPSWHLRWLLTALHCARWPTLGTGPVFAGYCGRYSGALSSSGLAARLQRALTAHHVMPHGGVRQYTLHSFRRGRLQHAAGEGLSHSELMRLGGIKSVDTLMRYLDRGRHL